MDINNYEPEPKKLKLELIEEEQLLSFNVTLNAETSENIYNLIAKCNMDTKQVICDGSVTLKDDRKLNIEKWKNDIINYVDNNFNKNVMIKALLIDNEFKTQYNLELHNTSKQKVATLKYSICNSCNNYCETEFNGVVIEHTCPPHDENINNDYANYVRLVELLQQNGY